MVLAQLKAHMFSQAVTAMRLPIDSSPFSIEDFVLDDGQLKHFKSQMLPTPLTAKEKPDAVHKYKEEHAEEVGERKLLVGGEAHESEEAA